MYSLLTFMYISSHVQNIDSGTLPQSLRLLLLFKASNRCYTESVIWNVNMHYPLSCFRLNLWSLSFSFRATMKWFKQMKQTTAWNLLSGRHASFSDTDAPLLIVNKGPITDARGGSLLCRCFICFIRDGGLWSPHVVWCSNEAKRHHRRCKIVRAVWLTQLTFPILSLCCCSFLLFMISYNVAVCFLLFIHMYTIVTVYVWFSLLCWSVL